MITGTLICCIRERGETINALGLQFELEYHIERGNLEERVDGMLWLEVAHRVLFYSGLIPDRTEVRRNFRNP